MLSRKKSIRQCLKLIIFMRIKKKEDIKMAEEQKKKGMLFSIRKWAKTEKGAGIMLRLSAKDGDEWKNINAYVPTEVNVKENRVSADAFARIKTSEKSGKKYAVVFIPLEDEYKPKLAPEEKTSEDLQDADIPF